MLIRTVECMDGHVEVELVCEPVFDYGAAPAEWVAVDGGRHAADATGAGQRFRLQSDLALGIQGERVRARHVLQPGDRAFVLLAEDLVVPQTVDDNLRPGRPALTTSLPETPGGERNWDYRYTWIRDTTFTLQALHFLNLNWEAEEFMEFIADLEPTEDGSLQIMYGIDGRRPHRVDA